MSESQNELPIPLNIEPLNLKQICEILVNIIKTNTPFSLVRIGDGEGFILGARSTTSEKELELILSMWFGTNTITDNDVEDIRIQLIGSIKSCDILGVHLVGEEISAHFARPLKTINELKLWNGITRICLANVHMHMHEHHVYASILRSLPFVGLVTPRDVARQLENQWGIGEVAHYSVPEEYHYAIEKNLVSRHYPDAFHSIISSIRIPYRGAVFLVGAGGLGKIYCHRIKELGGIALDIGSVFDAWAGHTGRGNVSKMRLGL